MSETVDTKRRTGRSTKLADKYVDEIFRKNGHWVQINDHHPTEQMSKHLAGIVWNRFKNEHHIKLDVSDDRMSLRLDQR